MDAIAFIENAKSVEPQPIYVLAGDEAFLKRLARNRIQELVLGTCVDDLARSNYEGESVPFATVADDLETMPFLSSRRMVVVQAADPFVSKSRGQLEKYLEKPSGAGVLVLEVKSWPSNTRLAKALSDRAVIKCEAPAAYRLPPWCVQWAARQYQKELPIAAANLLVELVGPEMGILDQELAKLTSYVGDKPKIEPKDVDTLVGHSRAQTAWQMLDAIAEGKINRALTTLQHLYDQGEEPIAVLGAMSWQLRRLAQAARLCKGGMSVGSALGRVGIPPFAQQRAEQQLRHLGRRALQIYDWLLDSDLALKSSHSFPARMVLERLLIKLAQSNSV